SDDVGYLTIIDRQDLNAIGAIDSACSVQLVQAKGDLTVSAGRQQAPASTSFAAENCLGNERANLVAPSIPARNGRHTERGIFFQQGQERINIGGFPGQHVVI